MNSFTHLRSALLAFTLAAGALCSSSSAHAQEGLRAATWGKPSASLGLRFGSDDLNLGLGARGGYTIEPGVYIGGMFDYFFGESEDIAGVGEVSFSAWMFMVEGGYDFGVLDGKLVLRPVLALGVVGVSAEACTVGGTCVDRGDTDFQAGLGGHVIYVMDSLTFGGELRLLFGDFDAFVLGGNVGMVF